MNNIKYIDIKEFGEKGYLQELNRLFLHPLGLALEVIEEADGSETLGGIQDYRDDPNGITYGLKDADRDRIKKFSDRALYINLEATNHINTRVGKNFNWGVELIPTEILQ